MNAFPIISLALGLHYKDTRIVVSFKYNQDLIAIIKQIPGARWSASMKRWHMPNTQNSVEALELAFKNRAKIDRSKMTDSSLLPAQAISGKGGRRLSLAYRRILNRYVIYLRGNVTVRVLLAYIRV